MRALAILFVFFLAGCLTQPEPNLDEACRDMCGWLNTCGDLTYSECSNAFCDLDYGPCNEDMRQYFMCVHDLDCGEPAVQCRDVVHEHCGGWL